MYPTLKAIGENPAQARILIIRLRVSTWWNTLTFLDKLEIISIYQERNGVSVDLLSDRPKEFDMWLFERYRDKIK